MQPSNYDFVNKVTVVGRTVDNTINEFFVRCDDEADTPINALIDKFFHYYRFHLCKVVRFYRDRYGDARRANSTKTYNQIAIARQEKNVSARV